MRVLLDEMLPIGLRDFLPEQDVATAAYVGLAGISNGEMLRRAAGAGFSVIITLDRGIPHQQDLNQYGIGLVLVPHNDLDRIRPYVDALRDAVDRVAPGSVVHVRAQASASSSSNHSSR